MAVRPIDGNELYRIEKLLDTDIIRQDKVAINLLEQVLYDIQHVPTLTLPNEWVSVEDALPPNMDDVLVVIQNNGECWTVTGYYSNTSNVWYAMLNGQDTQMDVLWWMPLPVPPDRRPPEGEEETRWTTLEAALKGEQHERG